MKRKRLAIAVLLAAGGLWFVWTSWRMLPSHPLSLNVSSKTPHGTNFDSNSAATLSRVSQTGLAAVPNNRPNSGQMLNPPARLEPPVLNRRFMDFTPEQRVEFARKGNGPGG